METNLKIAVLVAPARHPVSGRPRRSACDAAAFELACALAPSQQLSVISAGLSSRDTLDDYLGLGAGTIEVLTVAEDIDVLPALLARLHGFDLVLCGMRSEGQSASGMLPYLLAEGLKMPLVSDVLDAERKGGKLQVRQFLPKGMRRRLELATPAVLAVHQRAPQTRQYAYARARAGRVEYVAASIGGGRQSAPPPAPAWQFEAALRRPRPLKAKVVQSGHSRMQNAIGGGTATRAGTVIKQGSVDEKAGAILSYLRTHRLVDF